MVGVGLGVVAKYADAAFVSTAFDAEDDGFPFSVWFVKVGEVRGWWEREVVERFYGTRWIGCGGCHGDGSEI